MDRQKTYHSFIIRSFVRFFNYEYEEAFNAANNIIEIEDLLYHIEQGRKEVGQFIPIEYLQFNGPNLVVDVIQRYTEWKEVSEVHVTNTFFLKELENLIYIGKINIQMIKDYQVWRLILFYGPILSDKFNHQQMIAEQNERSNSRRKEFREERCLDILTDFVPSVIERAYIDAINFTYQDKLKALKIANEVKSSFKTIINEKNWIRRDTKNIAISKLNDMNMYIAYPDWIRDDNKLIGSLNLPMMRDDGILNFLLQLQLHIWKNKINKLGLKTEYEWSSSPVHSNAFYYRELNSIFYTVAYLRDHLFSTDSPDYFQFAVHGAVIGHEIVHGFDGDGLKSNGRWDGESMSEFKLRAMKLQYQYESIWDGSTGSPYVGKKTLNEDIADNGGIKAAYKAAFKGINEEERLPGFEKWSNKQMFFLSYANIFCRPLTEQIRINDEHSPPEYRVNVPLSNLNEFAKAFNCKRNSYMNPNDKAIVW